MLRHTTKSEEYIRKTFVHESEDHKRIAEALQADGKFGINVGPFEGHTLAFFIRLVRARTVVEVGTLYGYSTLWMARALPADGKIISLEKDESHHRRASELLKNVDVADKIDLRCGDAVELLNQITIKPDLIFIDANKPAYPAYLDWALKNISDQGLIIGDNTFLFGHLIGEDRGEGTSPKAMEAMTAFNKRAASESGFVATMIPTWEGMTLITRGA